MPREIEGFQLGQQQRGLWRVSDRRDEFRSQCAILIEGALDRERLASALRAVVEHHSALRTTFECLPGMDVPLQVVDATGRLSCKFVDGEMQPETALDGLFDEMWRMPFDLAEGPVARFRVLRLAGDSHVLISSLAALCGDSRTLDNVMAEVARAYAGEAGDEPLEYIQFSEWQNQLLAGQDEDPGRAFWRDNEVFSLPALTPPAEGTGRADGSAVCVIQGPFAEEETLLAAWHVLLYRLTGEPEFATAVLCDGRVYEEMSGIFGLCARWPLVPCRLERDFRFSEVIEQARHRLAEARSWQEYYGGSESDDAIGFSYETWPEPVAVPGTDLRFSMLRRASIIAPLKLCLGCTAREQGVELEFRYDRARYSASVIERLAEEYLALVNAAAAAPETRIGQLSLLGPRERQQVLREWNDRSMAFEPACVHELFTYQAARTPGRVAVRWREERWSYEELNRRANRLAHHLRALGVCRERPVALLLERGPRMIQALLGVLKAGGVYVPLDPLQPPARLRWLVADAQAHVVITESSLEERLAGVRCRVLCLQREEAAIVAQSAEDPAPLATPANLAYIIYTSGSTGEPKGVMVTHAAVANLAAAMEEAIYGGAGGELRVGLNAPLAFDASVKQIVQLTRGRTLDILPDEARLEGAALRAFQTGHRLDALDCTPGQLNVWLREGVEGLPPRLLVGGEALEGEAWRTLATSTATRAYNLYGPTECTVDATCEPVTAEAGPSLGRPISNVRVYVLDCDGQPAPIGVAGEIWIGGAGVARGYLGRPDLTAARFLPEPFTSEPGARLYRSGDRGRWHEDGRLEWLGRADEQVKVRGYRVEPGEISAALERHPAVGEAAVVLREDAPGDQRLVAYFTLDQRAGGRCFRLPNGLRVAAVNRVEVEALHEEIFEQQTYLRYGIEIPEAGCVWDVGANVGLFTRFVKQRCPRALVYAFEPVGPILGLLRRNVGERQAGVRVFGVGLSDRDGDAEFRYYPGYTAMSGLEAYADAEQEREVVKQHLRNQQRKGRAGAAALLENVDELLVGRFAGEKQRGQVRRLSSVLRETGEGVIDLLKIDVQRGEWDVLCGIEPGDWGLIRQIVMEVHDQPGSATAGRLRAVLALLAERGFDVAAEQGEWMEGTDRHLVYASRQGLRREQARRPAAEGNFAPAVVEEAATPEVLRSYLGEQLPEYMLPAAYVVVAQMPLRRNGKVDRRALPAPEAAAAGGGARVTEARGGVETAVCGIFGEVLRRGPVGREENFFELGGHSLLATQVVARLRAVFEIGLALRMLFERPTAAGLAQAIEAELRGGEKVRAPAMVRRGAAEAPLSFAQQRLWFLDRLEPGNRSYNIFGAIRLRGALRREALDWAFCELARRHEALRTRFVEMEGEPRQVIGPPPETVLRYREAVEADLQRLAEKEAARPFVLSEGPLLRVTLIGLGADEHVLMLAMHHIVADAWSLSILVEELGRLYAARAGGREAALAELPMQYADYAAWQREWLAGEELDRQLSYWRAQLAGAPAALELPTDRPRPAAVSHRGARHRFVLPGALSEGVARLSREQGVTLYMTLLAAFQTLLYRYSGQSDVVVGSPIAGRTQVETEGLIGFFLNTLVMRTKLEGDPTFVELLGRVKESALAAYAHQDLPFEKLVEELQPTRTLSHSPLFQVMFQLLNTPEPKLELPALSIRSEQIETSLAAKFDLSLSMAATQDGLVGVFEYSTDLWEDSTIQRMAGHLQHLLQAAVADPAQRISRLPLMNESEGRLALGAGLGAIVSHPIEAPIHRMFEEQAERTPDIVAVVSGGKRLTYRDLNRRSNQIARHVRALGAPAGSRIALCFEHGVDAVSAILGILKADCVYVSLPVVYPRARLRFILKDAEARLVITRADLADHIGANADTRFVLLDRENGAIERLPFGNLDSGAGPDAAAYVLYTSGSTGRPKGVCCASRGVVNLLQDFERRQPLEAGAACSWWTSIGFDVSVYETFSALLYGRTLHVVPEEVRADAFLFFDWLEKHGIRSAYITPHMLPDLAEWLRSRQVHLRRLLVGVEPISERLLAKISALAPSLKIINGYGPTETTICATLYDVPSLPSRDGSAPIGRPVQDTRVYVLDGAGQPVRAGIPGEIFVGGAGLAHGYFNRPDLTAECFVPDPYSGRAGARLYRTGDMARWGRDGQLEFLGRRDQQVKVRGYRVEPAEIEAVLARRPAVKECCVMLRPESGRLAAWVATNGPIQPGELRAWLQRFLPEHMVPTEWAFLPALPRQANGKVDRGALPAPEPPAAEPRGEPRSAAETILVEIWREVLGREGIGVNDNFFALGGDSILSLQIVSRARQQGLQLSVRDMFERQTIAELVQAARTSSAAEAPQGVVSGSAPLTPIQHWFFAQELPDPHHFNQAMILETPREIDAALLREAVTALLGHHDALRLRFRRTKDGWEQRIAGDTETASLLEVDLSALGEAGRRRAIEELKHEVHASLDLEHGPLLRAVLVRGGAGEPGRLLMVIHHLAVDGVSWRILPEDLARAYEQLEQGGTVRLPAKTSSWQQWAERLVEYAGSAELAEEFPYWREQTAERVARVRVDFADGANTVAEEQLVRTELSAAQTRALLEQAPEAARADVQEILLSALAEAWRLWCGEAVRVDVEGHGRETIGDGVDVSRTVGWFTAVYPVVLRAGTVKEQTRRIPGRGVGYGVLRYLHADPEVRASLAAPTAVSFNYLGQFDQLTRDRGRWRWLPEDSGPSHSRRTPRPHLISINGMVAGGKLELGWSYSGALFRRETVERLAANYMAALRELIARMAPGHAERLTPADVPLANLDQDTLDEIVAEMRRLTAGGHG